MQKRDIFIVWNETRSAAIVCNNKNDAMLAAGIIQPYIGCSMMCAIFNELHAGEQRSIEEVEEVNVNEGLSQ